MVSLAVEGVFLGMQYALVWMWWRVVLEDAVAVIMMVTVALEVVMVALEVVIVAFVLVVVALDVGLVASHSFSAIVGDF